MDTGASVTAVLDLDRERLGIEWDKLGGGARLGGIGGAVETRTIPDGRLVFGTDSGGTIVERSVVHVARHDLERLKRREKGLVMQLPSLLGRDVLQRYRFVYDKPRSHVHLER